MAAPKLSKTIGVKVVNGRVGETITLRNFTSGKKLTLELNANSQVVFNAAPASQWENGDDIQVEMSGRVVGANKTKISAGGKVINLVVSVDTTTPGVSL